MKKLAALFLTVVLLLSIAVMPASAEKGTIKLGGLAPLTGNYAEYGMGFQIAWQMAIDEINANGGANGYMLSIDVKDTAGDPVVSSTMATAFAEDDEILAILGDFSSGCCKANAPIVDRYGIVQLSPTASAPDYAGMSPYTYSIMGRQDKEAPFLATYVLKKYLGATKVAVIRVDSDWGYAAYTNFKAQADIEGLEVMEEKYKSDETDFSSIITKVKAFDPQVLIVMDQGLPVSAIFNAADSSGWDVQHVALGPGTSEQLLSQLIDPNNLIVTSPFFFDPENAELNAWKEKFVAAAGFQPTVHPACAYDTAYLIASAIESIGDGKVTRDAINDALKTIEFTGLTGRIQFEEAGDISRDYLICGVVDGQWKVLEGFEYSQE
ncbi:MAG TPA: ABC transporter substrate-binding protein [Candidatus Limiplasma sp.]|nr:ABC transporter substrate-binding protein [Candidatus Limiplasma sp.]HRX08962.1 ABC transporter substrate-binding protein [Candidatus Limiplasma sp.]